MLGPRISATLPASEDEGDSCLDVGATKAPPESPRVLDFSMPREATSLEEDPHRTPLTDRHCCASSDVMEAAEAVEVLHPIGQRAYL
jgi:hypothetical protein